MKKLLNQRVVATFAGYSSMIFTRSWHRWRRVLVVESAFRLAWRHIRTHEGEERTCLEQNYRKVAAEIPKGNRCMTSFFKELGIKTRVCDIEKLTETHQKETGLL